MKRIVASLLLLALAVPALAQEKKQEPKKDVVWQATIQGIGS